MSWDLSGTARYRFDSAQEEATHPGGDQGPFGEQEEEQARDYHVDRHVKLRGFKGQFLTFLCKLISGRKLVKRPERVWRELCDDCESKACCLRSSTSQIWVVTTLIWLRAFWLCRCLPGVALIRLALVQFSGSRSSRASIRCVASEPTPARNG